GRRGKVENMEVINWRGIGGRESGGMLMGCCEVGVVNLGVERRGGDGVELNGWGGVKVNGDRGIDSGDEGIGLVRY
ncbi:hypothetical protein, partial [Kocuria rosea]|uniref:hypothetical protein n=1 Tax=Kocuria rosea TaxID=1275 RepID=UPI001C92F216